MSNGIVIFHAPLTEDMLDIGIAPAVTPMPYTAGPPITYHPPFDFNSDGGLFNGIGTDPHGSDYFNVGVTYGPDAKISPATYVGKRVSFECTWIPLAITQRGGPNAPPDVPFFSMRTAAFSVGWSTKLALPGNSLTGFTLRARWYNNPLGVDADVVVGTFPFDLPVRLRIEYEVDGSCNWYIDGLLVNTVSAVYAPRLSNASIGPYAACAGNDKTIGSFRMKDVYLYTDFCDFVGVPLEGVKPLAVQFTDLSRPATDVSAWAWDFGDGNTGSTRNPIHTYASAGVYTVSLTVTIAGNPLSATKIAYVVVTAPVTPPTPLGQAIDLPRPILEVVRVVKVTPQYS